MELAKYKACICEGAAENAIMDILLDEELLVFSREEMLELKRLCRFLNNTVKDQERKQEVRK